MSKASDFAATLDLALDNRPRWDAPKATYCSNPNAIVYSPVAARVNNGGSLETFGLTYLSAEEALSLGYWIIDTFGEEETNNKKEK